MGEPRFEGGDVPKAKAVLEKLAKVITKCVNDHGGLHGAKGSIEVQFLVRAQGIAEGVDVQEAQGIDADAKKCVRDALKKKTIGPPSADPVGVTVKIDLEPSASPVSATP
jgi:3-hydroxyisobutyrate dehydrogenase-like beta-hydroxyacid dehydrogenase